MGYRTSDNGVVTMENGVRLCVEPLASSLQAVARASGFASAEVLRRAFHRRVGVSPAQYRERLRLHA